MDEDICGVHLIFLEGCRCRDLLREPYVRVWAATLRYVTVRGSCTIFGGEWTPSVCLIQEL